MVEFYFYIILFHIIDKYTNLKSANIVGCLDLTPYVYYLRSKVESIAFKIIKIGNTKRTQPIKFQ